MSDTGARSRGFEVGRVISGTFGVIGRNFIPFAVLAVILGGLPRLVITLVQLRFIDNISGPSPMPNFSPSAIGGWIVGALAMMVAGFVLQAAIVHATVADLNGRRVAIGESLKVGLRNCLPLIALAILMGLGLILGFALLFVPGVILAVMWSVAVPAKVVEKIGVTEAFTRSSDLTRGRRWPVFGLILIYVVAAWILEMVIMAAVAPFTLFKGLPSSNAAVEGFMNTINMTQLIAMPIVATISTLFRTAGGAALYFELRGSREGVGAEALASVFD